MADQSPVNPDLSPRNTSFMGVLKWAEEILSSPQTMNDILINGEKTKRLKELFKKHVEGIPGLQDYATNLDTQIKRYKNAHIPT